jgi:hypothetical protein
LHEHNAPTIMWAYAIQVAATLRNYMPSNGCASTPYELMFGKQPNVERLRVFGCAVTVHIPTKKRHKLSNTSMQGVFIGYAKNSKAWRVLVPAGYGSWQILESSNVRFNEDTPGKFPPSILCSVSDAPVDWCKSAAEDAPEVTAPSPAAAPDVVHSSVPLPTDPPAQAQPVPPAPQENVAPHENVQHGEHDPAPLPAGQQEVPPAAPQEPSQRYPKRDRQPSVAWFRSQQARLHITEGLTDHPATFKEAMGRPDKDLWLVAIEEELAALQARKVYTETTLPEHTTALPSKLVLDIKRDAHGNIDKYKARLVAKGFRQVAGRDYDEVFAPTVQHVTLRCY